MNKSDPRILKEIALLVFISSIAGALLALGCSWTYNMLTTDTKLRIDRGAHPPRRLPPEVADFLSRSTRFSGKVERYLLNPEGLIDGLILGHNSFVKFSPRMTDNLVAVAQPGDNVVVIGNPGIHTGVGQEIHAFSITNTENQRTVFNQPPLYPPPRNNYSNLSVQGNPQYWLVGHRGEINGVILSSGAQVRLPPHVGNQLFSLAERGGLIQAQGFGSMTRYGQVLAATSLTVNGQPINFYPDISLPGKRHKRLRGYDGDRLPALSQPSGGT